MLEGLKRLFARGASATQDLSELERWSLRRGWHLGVVREVDGFVIEGRLAGHGWRIEWGPSQRNYIEGAELRLRAEMPARSNVQAIVLPSALQADMESRVFDQIVEGVQTRIDDQTPPEMRWLVMFPKLPGSDMGRLRGSFVAVGPTRSWLQQWLDSELADALLAAPLADGQPMVLMISRGRMTLRTSMATPTPAALEPWVAVFEAALRALPEVDPVASQSGPPTGASLLGDAEEPPPTGSR